MRERRRFVWLAGTVLALALGTATGAGGQTPASAFSDLHRYLPPFPAADASAQLPSTAIGPSAPSSLSAVGSRVKPGAAIAVLVADGQQVYGTFVTASDEALAMHVGLVERTILATDIRQVVAAHGTNRTTLGIVAGGLLGVMIGYAACTRDPNYPNVEVPSCWRPVLASTAALAALDGVIGARRWRPAVVFPAPGSSAPAAAVHAEAPTAAPARPVTPRPPSDRLPVPSLDLVGSRVMPFDRIYVRTRDGRETTGDFRQASATQLQLEHRGQTMTVAAGDIRTVAVRRGTKAMGGMLFGLAGGVAMGALVAGMIDAPAWGTIGVALAFGTVGLIYGGVGGLLSDSRTLVYDADAPRQSPPDQPAN